MYIVYISSREIRQEVGGGSVSLLITTLAVPRRCIPLGEISCIPAHVYTCTSTCMCMYTVHVLLYMCMLEVVMQQVCMNVSCMLHTLYIPKVQKSLYFQHNSCNVHAALQLLCTHVYTANLVGGTTHARGHWRTVCPKAESVCCGAGIFRSMLPWGRQVASTTSVTRSYVATPEPSLSSTLMSAVTSP